MDKYYSILNIFFKTITKPKLEMRFGDLDMEEFHIRKFAKKQVMRLSDTNSLWDVIEMMNDFNIRHIPIVKGVKLMGIVNPKSLMHALENYTDPSTFEQEAYLFTSQDYIVVEDDVSVLDVISQISRKPELAALMMDGYIFQGIFTEMDILNNDYLWSKLDDFLISSEMDIGQAIDMTSCVPDHASIQQALELMLYFKTEIVGIIEEHSQILVGSLSFMDIVHFLMYHFKELGSELEYLWERPINTIFPKSGLYVKEPIMFSELRREMFENSSYLAILLNENSYPSKLISVPDLMARYDLKSGFYET